MGDGDPDLLFEPESFTDEAASHMGSATDELGGALGHSGGVQGKAGEAMAGWPPVAEAGQALDNIHQIADGALKQATDITGADVGNLSTAAKTIGDADASASAGAGKIRPDGSVPGGHGGGPSGPGDPTPGGGGSGPGDPGGSLGGAKGNPQKAGRDGPSVPKAGDPIDVATGDVVLDQEDLRLPGSLPLVLGRSHRSSYRSGRWFGRSWASTLDQRLEISADGVFFAAGDGAVLCYPRPDAGGDVVWPLAGARWPLARDDDGYTLTDPQAGTVHRFEPRSGYYVSADGLGELPLVSVTSRAGHQIRVSYSAEGEPQLVTHDGGYQVTVTTGGGRVTSISVAGAAGDGQDLQLLRYGYDEAGNLAEVINSSGLPLRFSYDGENRLTGWQDRNGWWYRYSYDDAGRCVRGDGPDGLLSGTFSYDFLNLVTRHTDAAGAVTAYELTSGRRVAAVTDPLGNITRSEYDRYGQLIAQTDPLGRTTRWEYDQAGNLITLTRPDGARVTARYNELSVPVEISKPGGGTWQQQTDSSGNVTRLTEPDGAVSQYDYDDYGNLAAVTDPAGAKTRVQCNPAGLVVAITEPDGAAIRYDRDACGRPVAVTAPDGLVTRMTWTPDSQLSSRFFADGGSERFSYDGERNLVAYRDPAGAMTRFEYTYLDQVAARISPDGTRTEFGYDHALRLTSVAHAGLTWRYDYDAAGRQVAETDYNGAVTRYDYDAAGQVTTQVNAAGQEVGFGWDLMGNLAERRIAAQAATFGYDLAGRLTEISDSAGSIVLERDRAGRVIAEICNGQAVRSQYDAAGRRVRRRTPSGAETEWVYDAAGRPVGMACAGQELRFGYDQSGRETQRQLPGGAVLTQDYDAAGRLATQLLAGPAQPGTAPQPGGAPFSPLATLPSVPPGPAQPDRSGSAGGRVLQRRGYSYRADGLLTGIDDLLSGHRLLALDRAGQVTNVSGSGQTETYGYDPAGNITAATWAPQAGGHGPGAPLAAGSQGAREYAGTLLTRAGDVRYRHDRAGRIIMRQQVRLSRKPDTWHYEWDAADRLTAVTTPDGTRWQYLYDPLGRRIAKQRLGPGGEIAEQTSFTWDGPVLAEQASTGPGDADQLITWDYQPGTFTPLVQAEHVRHAPQDQVDQRFYAIVTDLVGSPAELIDPAGELAGHQQQNLWGATGWQGASTPLRFPGQYADPETGLHYNNQRYYDPVTGGYLSPDPLGLTPAPNPHAYVPNPTILTDPLGLAPYNGTYEPSPKHGATQRGDAAPAPANGQDVLRNYSTQIKSTTTRRVGVDPSTGEFDVFDETHPGTSIYHGHARTWDELTQQMRNALVRAGLVTKRGKIIAKPPA